MQLDAVQQMLMAGRMITATFIDLAGLVNNQERWHVDGFVPKEGLTFAQRWCAESLDKSQGL